MIALEEPQTSGKTVVRTNILNPVTHLVLTEEWQDGSHKKYCL